MIFIYYYFFKFGADTVHKESNKQKLEAASVVLGLETGVTSNE